VLVAGSGCSATGTVRTAVSTATEGWG